MPSDSDEGQVHTVTMLVNDERVWFVRTAKCLESASSVSRSFVCWPILGRPNHRVPLYEVKTTFDVLQEDNHGIVNT